MRPCPFCGGDDIREGNGYDTYSGMYYSSYMYCIKCDARGPETSEYNPEEARRLWDERV